MEKDKVYVIYIYIYIFFFSSFFEFLYDHLDPKICFLLCHYLMLAFLNVE